MVKKETAKKSTTEKPTVKKAVEVKKEEPKPNGYLVPVYYKNQPLAQDDLIADIWYKFLDNSITPQFHAPQHEAHLEMIIEGDISIETKGNVRMVSKSDDPEEWIKNLVNSREFSGNPFIASEAQPQYEA